MVSNGIPLAMMSSNSAAKPSPWDSRPPKRLQISRSGAWLSASRNTRLARTVANALGAGHPAAHSTEGHLSRLRSMWARHRQFGGQER